MIHTSRALLLGALALSACAPSERSTPAAPKTTATPKVAPPVQEPEQSVPEPPKLPPASVRADLVALSHFAVHHRGGSFQIDAGHDSARAHLMGGWRSGWNQTPRRDGEDRYLEVNAAVARVFFKHSKGGFDRIELRVRSARPRGKVAVRLGGKLLGEAALTNTWSTLSFKVPEGLTRDGEHQIELKFVGSIRLDRRTQVAHVDRISILAPGAVEAPAPLDGRRLERGGQRRSALVVSAPGAWIWRLSVPGDEAALRLDCTAAKEGARVVVRLQVDGQASKILMDEAIETGAQTPKALDLTPWAGRVAEIEVEISGRVDGGNPVIFDGRLVGAPALPVEVSGERAKHVLVFLVDTLRRDKLGIYNSETSVPTPHFDAFGRDAAVFESAYDTENWTKPSTASILTGLYSWHHRTKDGDAKLPTSVPLISEHLRREGFATAAFIANGYVSRTFGFARGWDRYTNYIRERKVTDAANLVSDTLAWIDKQGDERWFAYVHTIDPHVPYSAPGPWKFARWDVLRRGKYQGPLRAQNTGTQIADMKTGKLKPTEADRVYFQALYDGEVAYNDNEFGRLLDGLRERGLYDDTLIIVLADHGEEFWDHGSLGHGHSLYDEMVHTPLLVRHPGTVPAGRRLEPVVSTASVVPTVLAVLGAEPMEGLDAGSLIEVLDGVGSARPRAAVTDFMYRRKSIRAGRYHWLTDGVGGWGALYDVVSDPGEEVDLKGTHPIGLAFARARFGFLVGAASAARWWEPGGGAKVSEVEGEVADIDDELRRQLEAMGYIEGATGEHTPSEDREKMKREDGGLR